MTLLTPLRRPFAALLALALMPWRPFAAHAAEAFESGPADYSAEDVARAHELGIDLLNPDRSLSGARRDFEGLVAALSSDWLSHDKARALPSLFAELRRRYPFANRTTGNLTEAGRRAIDGWRAFYAKELGMDHAVSSAVLDLSLCRAREHLAAAAAVRDELERRREFDAARAVLDRARADLPAKVQPAFQGAVSALIDSLQASLLRLEGGAGAASMATTVVLQPLLKAAHEAGARGDARGRRDALTLLNALYDGMGTPRQQRDPAVRELDAPAPAPVDAAAAALSASSVDVPALERELDGEAAGPRLPPWLRAALPPHWEGRRMRAAGAAERWDAERRVTERAAVFIDEQSGMEMVEWAQRRAVIRAGPDGAPADVTYHERRGGRWVPTRRLFTEDGHGFAELYQGDGVWLRYERRTEAGSEGAPLALRVEVPPMAGSAEARARRNADIARRVSRLLSEHLPVNQEDKDWEVDGLTTEYLRRTMDGMPDGGALIIEQDRAILSLAADGTANVALHRVALRDEADAPILALPDSEKDRLFGVSVFEVRGVRDGQVGGIVGYLGQDAEGGFDGGAISTRLHYESHDFAGGWLFGRTRTHRAAGEVGGEPLVLEDQEIRFFVDHGGTGAWLNDYGLWGAATGAPVADWAGYGAESVLIDLDVDRGTARIFGDVLAGFGDLGGGILAGGKIMRRLEKLSELGGKTGRRMFKSGALYMAAQGAVSTAQCAADLAVSSVWADAAAFGATMRCLLGNADTAYIGARAALNGRVLRRGSAPPADAPLLAKGTAPGAARGRDPPEALALASGLGRDDVLARLDEAAKAGLDAPEARSYRAELDAAARAAKADARAKAGLTDDASKGPERQARETAAKAEADAAVAAEFESHAAEHAERLAGVLTAQKEATRRRYWTYPLSLATRDTFQVSLARIKRLNRQLDSPDVKEHGHGAHFPPHGARSASLADDIMSELSALGVGETQGPRVVGALLMKDGRRFVAFSGAPPKVEKAMDGRVMNWTDPFIAAVETLRARAREPRFRAKHGEVEILGLEAEPPGGMRHTKKEDNEYCAEKRLFSRVRDEAAEALEMAVTWRGPLPKDRSGALMENHFGTPLEHRFMVPCLHCLVNSSAIQGRSFARDEAGAGRLAASSER